MDFANKFTDRIIKMFPVVVPYLHAFLNMFKNIFGIYILWIFLHFASSHMYVKLCTPGTITGFLLSPFMAAAPHCQALRWVLYNGGNSIISMWVTVGLWLLGYLKPITNNFVDNIVGSNVNEKNE
jgi:hypothetical protein